MCEPLKVKVGAGFVMLLVKADPNISVCELISKVKSWTTTWITENISIDVQSSFWAQGCYLLSISPEDKDTQTQSIDAISDWSDPQQLALQSGMNYIATRNEGLLCHHILLITSRTRLLLRLKYSSLLAELAKSVAKDLGAADVICSARRNHLHILCYLPAAKSISSFIESLKAQLLARMHSNIHFRKAEEWSEKSIAHTVSPSRILQEEHDIVDQAYIHRRFSYRNEMAVISTKLGIPFFASLH